ncbi:MAG: twin transmembrane helix small protein [Rhodospirillales bacterium]
MDSFLPFALGLAMFATLAVLVVGVISFAVNGRFYKKNSNKLMRWRVLLQGIALLIFAAITLLSIAPPR